MALMSAHFLNTLWVLTSPSTLQPSAHGMPLRDVSKWTDTDNVTLVHTTMASLKAKGYWGDYGPKSNTYVGCETALKGTKKISGGSPKSAKACRNRWNQVSILPFQIHAGLTAFLCRL